ncbi:MAG TPA: AraC family transcriptional regulator [Chloroflexia bacterium]|nr:AraC family transcriptional regulator [Chloroflexia bacterium]
MKAWNIKESTNFWLDPDLGNLEFLHARYVTHAFSRHAHDGYAIGVIVKGAEEFEYRHTRHVAPEGSLVVINPGEMHTGQAYRPEGWSYRMLYPDSALLQEASSQIAGRSRDVPFFAEPVITDKPLAEQLVKLHQALEEPLPALERQSRMLWFFGQFVSRHADDRPAVRRTGEEQQVVRRVRDYLENHYYENLTLEHLSQIAGLSPFHLLRIFRDAAGLPPHTYLNQIRISRAKTLLLKGWPIATVAHETGFVDQSHFTRQFKRIIGVTPGQYVLNSKNIQDNLRAYP